MFIKKITLSTNDAARLLGVSVLALKQYAKQGLLTKYNNRYELERLQEFIINRKGKDERE